MALTKVSSDWPDFKDKLDIAYPKFDDTFTLPFENGRPRLANPACGERYWYWPPGLHHDAQ
jgi:hypothetical protein